MTIKGGIDLLVGRLLIVYEPFRKLTLVPDQEFAVIATIRLAPDLDRSIFAA